MKYPEVLLLPIMMFADYFLTVLGSFKREKGYSEHFKTQHYELNPIWQKSITDKRWFNLRHITLTIFVSGILIILFEYGDIPHGFVKYLLGSVIVLCGMVLGRHFSNLLIFSCLIRKPQEVSGEVTMSHQFVLYLSLNQALVAAVPVALIAILSQDNFARGGISGIVLFMIINLRWIHKAKKHRRSKEKLSFP